MADQHDRAGEPRARTSWVLVLALMMALALSFADRQVLALLVDPIKADMGLSDTSFGILQGVAFAVFYIGLGVPLGRLADRVNRRNLIIVAIVIWSIATMAFGTSTSFATLFMWRALVGVGEAALSPAAYSMITDAVPKRRLSSALAVYSTGVYLGSGLALLGGAVVLAWLTSNAVPSILPGEPAPWRIVFLLLGLPGLLMAGMFFFVVEPARRQFNSEDVEKMPSVGEAVALILRERRVFGGLILGFAGHNVSMYALLNWIPAFMGRRYDLAPSELGVTLGLLTIACGIAGLLLGGMFNDRMLAKQMADSPIRMGIASMIGIGLFTFATVYAGSFAVSALFFGVTIFFVALPIGCAAAALQLIVSNRFRGQISAVYLTAISLAGLTLGPVLPPAISDTIFRDTDRIGDALVITLIAGAAVSIAVFLLARPAYAQRYRSIHQ